MRYIVYNKRDNTYFQRIDNICGLLFQVWGYDRKQAMLLTKRAANTKARECKTYEVQEAD